MAQTTPAPLARPGAWQSLIGANSMSSVPRTDLKARLDRSGSRVMCGVVDCGQQLGKVIERFPWRDNPYSPRGLCLGPGYREDEHGIWSLSSRANKRFRQGKLPRESRNPLAGSHHEHDARLFGRRPFCLPADIRCPKCGFVQSLDPDALRVVILPRELWSHAKQTWEICAWEEW